MRSRHLLLASTAILLAAVAGGLGWYGGRTSQAHDKAGESTDSASAGATDGIASPPSPVTQRPPDRPLPALDQPLRAILPELKRRADAGEAAATCRLAAELDFCAQIHMRLAGTSNMLRVTQRLAPGDGTADAGTGQNEQQKQMQQAMLAQSERLLEESAHCDGVPASTPAQRIQYWRSAALAGNPMALRIYATGSVFRPENLLEHLDALRLYRDEAESLALRAARSGDQTMVMALGHAYSPDSREQHRSLLAQAIEPDGARALAFLLHARDGLPRSATGSVRRQAALDNRLADSIEELETRLDAGSIARARQLAADMARDYAPAPGTRPSPSPGRMEHSPGTFWRANCATGL